MTVFHLVLGMDKQYFKVMPVRSPALLARKTNVGATSAGCPGRSMGVMPLPKSFTYSRESQATIIPAYATKGWRMQGACRGAHHVL